MHTHADRNVPSGTNGLIAVDKVGNRVLFLDPSTLAETSVIDGFAPKVHELLISEDHSRAYVPIYGDGIHGNNPDPGHLIAVIDLPRKRHIADFSVAPYLAPHGMRWGSNGRLYCICENSGVVLEMNAATGNIEYVLDVGSNKGHRIEVLPDGSKLYAETEEDGFLSIIDLRSRTRLNKVRLPGQLDGLGMSPDGRTIVVVSGQDPLLFVVNTASDEVVRTVTLTHHKGPAQIARFSPNGAFLVVTSHDQSIGTIFDESLQNQSLIRLGKGPMDMAFHPDGRTVFIANQDEGTISVVDLLSAEVLKTAHVGVGVETLSFY